MTSARVGVYAPGKMRRRIQGLSGHGVSRPMKWSSPRPPSRRSVRAEHFGERVEVRQPDVFEHADGDEHVVCSADVAVVVVDELDAIRQAFARGATPGEGQLFGRQVEGLHADAVVPGHEERQRAPAAAGFDDRVARPQLQLAADEIQLGALRLIE